MGISIYSPCNFVQTHRFHLANFATCAFGKMSLDWNFFPELCCNSIKSGWRDCSIRLCFKVLNEFPTSKARGSSGKGNPPFPGGAQHWQPELKASLVLSRLAGEGQLTLLLPMCPSNVFVTAPGSSTPGKGRQEGSGKGQSLSAPCKWNCPGSLWGCRVP